MATAEPEELSNLPLVPQLGHFSTASEARRLFEFLKSTETLSGLQNRSFSFSTPGGLEFQLTPIADLHLKQNNLIRQLMKWRQSYPTVFNQDTEISEPGTKKWLRERVLEEPDRMLFLIEDSSHARYGHLGLWVRDGWRLELDNVVKRPDVPIPWLMSSATVALGKWCNEFLGADEIFLRVLRNNSHAFEFYRRLGFSICGVQSMKSDLPLSKSDLTRPDDAENTNLDPASSWFVMSRATDDWKELEDQILTAGPSIGPLESSLTVDAVRSGWNNHHSDYLTRFSDNFAEYVGAQYAIPTDSCTSALHLALWALGIGPNDEVIVPEVTWVATANAALYVGAAPVFADIDSKTWCLDPDSVEALITEKTRAIIPVHLYGYVANIHEISQICVRHGIYLVQDAAPGIGSMYGSKSIAAWGEFSCFSFQGAKLLVSGEGGVLTTNDESLYKAALKIADSGRRPGTFWIDVLGKKMKMSNLTASLALAQLLSAERQIARKRQIRDWYVEDLEGHPNIRFQEESPETRSICWMTSIYVDQEGFDRELLRKELMAGGIDTRPVFSPISRYPHWPQRYKEGPVAGKIGDNAINLPSGVGLSRSAVARVSRALKDSIPF